MTRHRPALRPRLLAAALAALLLGGTAPTPAAVGAAPATTADDEAGRPSIAYEEAMAHEGDAITFQPGGRVEVGFSPRADDAWPIDGDAPRRLPAGRATGRDMANSPQGSRWSVLGDAPADGPGSGPPAGEPVGSPDPSTDPSTDVSPAASPEPTADPTPAATPDSAGQSPAPTPETSPDPTAPPVDAPANGPAIAAQDAAYAGPQIAPDAVPAAASGLRRQVFGFLPYWEVSGASTRLNYDVLSTIAYFSVGADKAGNLRKKDSDGTSTTGWGGWTSSSMTAVINAAHQRGTRVVLTVSVFAWTTAQANTQRAILGSSAARLNLARQAAAAIRDRGADGVNLDFEPLAKGYADEFVALLRTVRAELNRIAPGYQLTYDTTGYIGNYPLEGSVGRGAADAIFIMGYDYRTASSATAGSIDPLSGPKYDLTDTVRAYTARVPASRLILGLPWYGRAWSTVSDAVRSLDQSGAKYGYSTAVNYDNVVDLVDRYGRRWDAAEQSPYVVYRRENCTSAYGCVTSWRQVYYEDAASMKLRYAMVNDYGLRGAGIWALGYDGGHSELYRAISESFLVDKSGPQAGITMLATTQPDEGFVVAWSARDASAIVSYDVQASTDGGAWAAWLTGTRATSEVWPGRDGQGYAFRVRAKDTRGNVGAWNVTSTSQASPKLEAGGFGRVRLDGLAYRTGPGTEAAKLGALPLNTIVAITRGPVVEDGYTWWEITQPIREWGPVSFVERGVWVADGSATKTYLSAFRAPNSTTVGAGITGLDFGSGASNVGTSAVAAAARQLSPNGDGSRDVLRLRWTNEVALEALQLNVYRTDGTLAGSRPVPDLAAGAQAWNWNGEIGGARVPDGRYMLQLSGTADGRTYRAPSARPVTAAQVTLYGVVVDTVPPTLTAASTSGSLISPNRDGVKDTVKLALSARAATHWAIQVGPPGGTAVRTVSGAGGSGSYTWNGTSDAGAVVADGAWQATLTAFDDAGNGARRTYGITVDTTPPPVTPAASPARVSPDGDGATDRTRLSATSGERVSGTARLWRGTTLVRSWTLTSVVSWAATWNGLNASGRRVADGRYTLRVAVRDAGGNRTTVATPVVVDRTASYLRWSGSFFPQDGDRLRPKAALSWKLARQATTTLRVLDGGGSVVRTAWTGRVLAAGSRSWTWDGRLSGGGWAPQGRYVAELTATSSLGTTVLRRPVWASGFAATLSAATVRPGQRFSVTFRTVEPLSTRPRVTFTQPGRGAVTVTATRRADGSYRAMFTVQAGGAGAGSVRIGAKDSGGGRNTTTLAIRVAP